MPELSNAGSGVRATRSGRNHSQIQTRVGPTEKVKLMERALPLEDSQAIMSGGMAQASGIGAMGQAMSGFFGAIAEVDSTLKQVERSEEIRVATEAKREREKLEAVTKQNMIINQSGELFANFKASVLNNHNVLDSTSLADKADEYFQVNFGEGTGDPVVDMMIANEFDTSVMPYITAATEGRAKAVVKAQTEERIAAIATRTSGFNTKDFVSDFDAFKALSPSSSDSEISAYVMSKYEEISRVNGTTGQFNRFLSNAPIIKTDKGFISFEERFPVEAAVMIAKNHTEHQANQTAESESVAGDITGSIADIDGTGDWPTELATVSRKIQDFRNLYGDDENASKLESQLSDRMKDIADIQLANNQWSALSSGHPTNMKGETYNKEQLLRLRQNTSTDIFNTNLTDEEFAKVSTNAATVIAQQVNGMGGVSPRLGKAIGNMMASKDPTQMDRAFRFLRKLDVKLPDGSSRVLNGHKSGQAIFSALSAQAANDALGLDHLVQVEDFQNAIQDQELVASYHKQFLDEFKAVDDITLFNNIMEDGFIDDNDHKESIAAHLGLDEDDIFIPAGREVAKSFLDTLTYTAIMASQNGDNLDSKELIERAWDSIMPNLRAEMVSEDNYRIVLKPPTHGGPDHLSSTTSEGNLHNEMPESSSSTNPYRPSESVNPNANMRKSAEDIASMPFIGDSDAVGFRSSGNGDNSFIITQKDQYGNPIDLILGIGETYDVTRGWSIDKASDLAVEAWDTSSIPDSEALLELTGDLTVDNEAMRAIEKRLPESMHLIPIFPNGTSAADRKNGTGEVLGYKIGVYPHLKNEEIPSEFHSEETMEELSEGNHVDPSVIKKKTTLNAGRLGITPMTNSQSTKDQRKVVIDGVTGAMKKHEQIAPTIGLTTDVSQTDTSKLDDLGWFVQDMSKKVTDFMGTDSDPTYKERRFNMIAEREAWRAGAYWDGVKKANGGKGYRTVGYGFNLDSVGHKDLFIETLKVDEQYYDSVYAGDVQITEAQGRKLFDAAVDEAESIIDNKLKDVDMNNQQRLALVSMAYNSPKLIGPNLVSHLQKGDWEEAINEILYRSNGTRMLGLYNRRYEEALTFAGAGRNHGMPSYISYMAEVLPKKYAPNLMATKNSTSSKDKT